MYRTPEKIKQNYVQCMGASLGARFYSLYHEIAMMYLEFTEFESLFVEKGENSNKIELLNKTAPTLFCVVQKKLIEGIILHITRITDPPRSKRGEHECLSISRLPKLIKEKKLEGAKEKDCDVEEKMEREILQPIRKLINDTIEHAVFAREYRNKFIAHSEIQKTLENVNPIEQVTLAKMRVVINDIIEVFNKVLKLFDRSKVEFENSLGIKGAESLFVIIESGLKAQTERKKRILAGDIVF
jgi:hypothetical protein